MDLSPKNQQEKQNDINLQAFDLLNDTDQQEGSSNKLNQEQQVQDSSQIKQTQQEPVNLPENKNGQLEVEQQNQDQIKQTANDVCQEILEKVVVTAQDQNQNSENFLNETEKKTSHQMQENVEGNVQEPQGESKTENVDQNLEIDLNQQLNQNENKEELVDQNQEDKNQVLNSQENQNVEQTQQDLNQTNMQQQVKSSETEQNLSQNNSQNVMQQNEKLNSQDVKEVTQQNENVEAPKDSNLQQADKQEQQMEIEEDNNVEEQTQPLVVQTQQVAQNVTIQNEPQEKVEQQKTENLKVESSDNDNNAPVLTPQVYLFQKQELLNLTQQKEDVLTRQINLEQNFQNRVSKLVQGKDHILLLTKQGEVYAQGDNQFGQCGTETNTKNFQKVTLNENIDLLDAGENFSFAANSKTGNCYIWGKLSSRDINLIQYNVPKKLVNKKFKKDLIKDIKCGNNHVLILSKTKIYVYGDKTFGALGNVFRKDVNRCDFQNLTTVNLKGVQKIFAFGNQSFAVTKRTKKTKNREIIYCFGSNNFQQLGFESELKNKDIEPLPFQWTEIHGDEVADITGTDEYTMVLYKNGSVYASGQNNNGQLGELDKQSEPFGSFEKIKNIPFKVSKLKCFRDFNFAVNKNTTKSFLWGSILKNQPNQNLTQLNIFPTLVSDISSTSSALVVLAETQSEENNLKKKRDYKGPELAKTSKVRIQQQLN